MVIANLTRGEWQFAMIIHGGLGIVGLAMAIAGSNDLLGAHGWIVLAVGLVGFFAVGSKLDLPSPDPRRLDHYYDDPTRVGIILTLIWGVRW